MTGGPARRSRCPAPPLADEAVGIVLRPWRAGDAGDAAALAAAWADPEVAAHAAVPADAVESRPPPGGSPARPSGAAQAGPRPGDLGTSGPAPGAGGSVLGEVGLAHLDGAGRAEVGFWLAPAARGRGVATAAVRLLTAWARARAEGLGLRQLWARTTPGDERAAGVLRRAGFGEQGEAGGTTVWVDAAR